MPKNLSKPKQEPAWDPDESDVGERTGRWQTEHGKRAKYAAALQTVKSLGRRPQDWIKRELLAGASGDDPRNWFIRSVLRHNPSFLQQPGDRISDSGAKQVIREARAFDYMSRHHLYRLVDELPNGSAVWKAAAAAAVCPTSLFESCEKIPHEFAHVRKSQVCQSRWCCPHCYARSVAAQLDVAKQLIAADVTEFVAVFSQAEVIDLDDADRINRLREHMRKELIQLARLAGGVGGIWSQQISPVLKNQLLWEGDHAISDGSEGFEFRFAVLAAIPRTQASLKRLQQFDLRSLRIERLVEVDVQRYDPVRSLRACLIKSRDSSQAKVRLVQNSYGVFYWPPLSLCSATQWMSRFAVLQKQPVFGRWGSWSQRAGKACAAEQSIDSTLTPSVHGRQSALLRSTEPVLLGLGFPNIPLPGRKKLREALANSGICCSERDVRWLLSHLVRKG